MASLRSTGGTLSRRRRWASLAALVLVATLAPSSVSAADDPRVGLAPGYLPWSEASSNIELLDNDPRVAPFDAAPVGFGGIGFANSDLAFSGEHAIVGSFNGFQVYDVSDGEDPVLRKSFVCPGGQGDVSVFGDLLFMSVEETRGRIDCGSAPITDAPTQRFRGVRIFDISDIDNPVQLPGVQTCRGSHTHTLVSDPDDPANVYVYNSGTSSVRSAAELAGCENANSNNPAPVTSGNPAQWRIDVIKVPLAAPQTAAIVNQPRIFSNPATGAYNGLLNTTPGTLHPSGTPYSPLPNTNTCHDITAYPALGLAAGACGGNGILLDISDPVNPVRLDAVADPNFSYWHSATFNNDGTKVIFTDEWGGGTSARCRATDQLNWGADAIFDIASRKMSFKSYYKMPAAQTTQENCVAHNSSLVPVPGRDILVQAWYQGGLSVIDFTDSSDPKEIAYFDRGPITVPGNPTGLNLGGLWSTYWYNGTVFGTEIARGFDAFGLKTSEQLSENELAAARSVQVDEFNPQHQTPLTWEPSYDVVGAFFDQAVRSGALSGATLAKVEKSLEKAEELDGNGDASIALLNTAARQLDSDGDQGELLEAIEDLTESLAD